MTALTDISQIEPNLYVEISTPANAGMSSVAGWVDITYQQCGSGIPSSAVQLDRSSTLNGYPVSSTEAVRGMNMPADFGNKEAWVTRLWSIVDTSYAYGCPVILIDRLAHMAGLSAALNTVQDLSPELTAVGISRLSADYTGVMIAVTSFADSGTTQVDVSCTYTNENGTSGRTTPSVFLQRQAESFKKTCVRVLPLQAGDRGVRSVQSLQLSASTGSAGNIGIFLFKPIMPIHSSMIASLDSQPAGGVNMLLDYGMMAKIDPTACIQPLCGEPAYSSVPFKAVLGLRIA